MDLRANTAVDVLIGPFVDKTDGNTTEDGLTLTQAEIKLSKLGQGLTQKNESTSAAFDDDGYYNCMLDATDTNTEGNLVLIVHQSANALPVRHEFNVLAEAAWDSLYVAKDSGFMDVNIKAVSDDTDSADNLELDYDGTGFAKANSTIGTTTTNTDMVGTDSAALASVCTEGRLAELDAGNLPTDIAAIPTTAMRGTDNAALASVLGAIDDTASAGDPTASETALQYLKQLVNTLEGTAGIPVLLAPQDPANDVSIVEMVHRIFDNLVVADTAIDAIPTTAMRGTDSAALATALATAQLDLDKITGTNGVLLSSAQVQAWASALEATAEAMKEGTAKAGTLTTTTMSTTLTEVDDVFNDQTIVFKADTTTAALRLQKATISDYANTNGVLTFSAITTAPSATETFVIL